MNARSLRSRAGFARFVLLSALPLSIAPAAVFADIGPTSFIDEFNSPTLNSAWQVVEFTGTRVYGYTSPANHISLTDNPGNLRYYVDPMTYMWGFLNGHQILHSTYDHDYGLELHRSFSGEHWRFETRADYYLPYTNGRGEGVLVYFGDGGANTLAVGFGRSRDVCDCNGLTVSLHEKDGPAFADVKLIERYDTYQDRYGPAESTYFYRLERDGSVLTTWWSSDGVAWTHAWSHDMGSDLDGLQQRLVITGLSWFDSAGSYADYDYVKLTPQPNRVYLPLISR